MQLTLAQEARILISSTFQGMLSTLRKEDGFPFGSIINLMPLKEGDLIFLLSNLSEHQKYLEADPRASVLIAPKIYDPDPLSSPRATLLGSVEVEKKKASLADSYLECHPEAEAFIWFVDFQFYRLYVDRVRYISGFSRMGWIEKKSYQTAKIKLGQSILKT